jgi:hypothetical protein
METLLRVAAVLTVALLTGCSSLGPKYKGGALDGIIAGSPRVAEAPLPAPKALTIGLITSDATEQTLEYLAEWQKKVAGNIFSENVRQASASYDPKIPVTYVADLLRSRFGEVRLIPDMNALSSLPQPAMACVLDLRLAGTNDLGGQRVTSTSELHFLDASGTVKSQVKGSAFKHNSGAAMGQAAQRAWMTVQSSTLEEAMDDMRRKLDQKLRTP